MRIKKAYSIQMSYDVTDDEKQQAEKALLVFNATKSLLSVADDYLLVLHTPFSNDSNIEPDQIYKYRAALRRFRDKMIEHFNNFKVASFKCVKVMNAFSSDTQTIKLMKAFINSIEELEAKVNIVVDLFDDLKNKNFPQEIVKSIEAVQKKCKEIETLIDERIKNHIKNNILSKSWVDNISNELQTKIEKKLPIMLELYSKRKDEIAKKFNGEGE